jgi:hypothetical protein
VTAVTGSATSERAGRRGADRRTVVARIGLVLVGAAQAELAIWGLVAPHSLYNSYPGAGRHWISALGPYNEHLIRDFAAAELGFAVLLLAAAVWFTRTLVLAAGIAFLVATIPHFIYHLTTTGSFSTGDNIASLGGFVLELALIGIAMAVAAAAPAAREDAG